MVSLEVNGHGTTVGGGVSIWDVLVALGEVWSSDLTHVGEPYSITIFPSGLYTSLIVVAPIFAIIINISAQIQACSSAWPDELITIWEFLYSCIQENLCQQAREVHDYVGNRHQISDLFSYPFCYIYLVACHNAFDQGYFVRTQYIVPKGGTQSFPYQVLPRLSLKV